MPMSDDVPFSASGDASLVRLGESVMIPELHQQGASISASARRVGLRGFEHVRLERDRDGQLLDGNGQISLPNAQAILTVLCAPFGRRVTTHGRYSFPRPASSIRYT